MKTLRILALTSLVAGFGLMTSCDSTASSSAPEITEFATANFTDESDTWTSGMDLEFYGTAKDDNSLKTLKLDIVNSTGTAVYTSTKNVSGTSVDFGANKSTVFTIGNPGTWAAGAYMAKLTATDNDGLATTKTITLAKVAGTGTSTALTESTIALGGAGSALPSFLDVDAMAALSATAAKAAQASVDLRFNNTLDSKNEVRAPSEDGSLTTNGWTVRNATKFHKVASGSYAAATTAAAVTALFDATKGQSTQLILAEGDELVVKSVENNVRIIKVSITKNSGATTVEFSVKGKK